MYVAQDKVPNLGGWSLTSSRKQRLSIRVTPIDSYRGLVEGLFRSDFYRFQGIWVEQHLRLMKSLREHFGNDLDKIMIVAMIGQQQLRDAAVPRHTYAPTRDGALLGSPARYTNVSRLAAATGIPRESVRRKVDELIDRGLVVRVGSRGLAVPPRAAVDLQSATLTVFDVLDRLFAEFAAALIERGDITIERRPSGASRGR